ncbi:MAG: hypothetical protein PF636_09500 [Actinomycetota bacterium]|nr:hypothetical protein [Actinomycetota bacterium]
MKRMMVITFLVLALSGGATAYADETIVPAGGTSEHVSQTTATTSGAEALTTVFQQLRGIQLGSSAATVTLDVEGTETPMVVEYGDMLGGGEGGVGGGLMSYGAIGLGAGVFIKLLRVLMRLGRG